MDASEVIEINDSIITVESEDGTEEGEVNEVEDEVVNIAAKLDLPQPSPPLEKKEQNSDAQLVFEVKFHKKNTYEQLHGRLINILNLAFDEEQFVFKASDDDSCVYVHRTAETPLPESNLFQIDTAPADKLNAAQVPSYKRCNTDVLDEQTSERKKLKIEAVNKCFRPKAQLACFNCGETDHSLRECPRPRNIARIQRARKSKRTERYHVDTEQRFAHIKPGKISSKTRHAMGYSRGELPFMFYRMRVLGYPPAWLEEAKVQSSGLTLFNADGSEVQGPEEEEGESDSYKYDVNKIIDFPGFNVAPGPNFFDDYKHHNVPRFQEKQLKEHFIKSLGENVTKGYKRKKLIDLPAPHDANDSLMESDTNLVEHDMELVDDDAEEVNHPIIPADSNNSAPQEPPAAVTEPEPVTEITSPRSPSPTLDDLKAQQELLLQKLESNTSLNASQGTEQNASNADIEENVNSPMKEMSNHSVFKGPSIEGTPLLKFSEYDKLPMGSNFKVGVSDVINFENLPDSTGKYEQMKGLLKNVRRKMEELQKDDDN